MHLFMNIPCYVYIILNKDKKLILYFFGGGRGSNPRPYIFYALFLPTELSSRGHQKTYLTLKLIFHLELQFF